MGLSVRIGRSKTTGLCLAQIFLTKTTDLAFLFIGVTALGAKKIVHSFDFIQIKRMKWKI